MKKTTFRNSIIFSSLIMILTMVMSIGYSAFTQELKISSDIKYLSENMLVNNTNKTYFLDCTNIRSVDVKKVLFKSRAPSSYNASCDVSAKKNKSVMAYKTTDGSVYIVSNAIYVFSNTSTKFWNLVNVNEIDFGGYFNTKYLKNMDYMFSYLCSNSICSMTKLDLSSFNTKNVSSMISTFEFAKNVKNIDCSFNTGNVIDMLNTFQACESLTVLDLSTFDTKKVKGMAYMFKDSKNLSTVYVSDLWSTASVTDGGSQMFSGTLLRTGTGNTCLGFSSAYEYARIDKPGYPGCFRSK